MAQTFQALRIAEGHVVDYTPSSAVVAGQVVVIDSLIGIAHEPIAANILGALSIDGIFDVVKVNGALTAGSVVYWDADGNPQGGTAGTGGLTSTSSGNTRCGIVLVAAGATDEKVRVLWQNPISVTNTTTSVDPLSNVITDPGDTGAIPVTESGHCALVSAGTETRTLAAPTFAGQQLLLQLKTDGGTLMVASATTLNQTGNNRIAMNDSADWVQLVAIALTSTLVWRIVGSDGVALTTV